MLKPVLLWEILVPCMMQGRPVHTRHHKEFDKVVRSISGGLTILMPAKGQWIHKESGTLYEERMIPVRVACTQNQIKQIMRFTLDHYKQLSVMAYLVSETVLFETRSQQ